MCGQQDGEPPRERRTGLQRWRASGQPVTRNVEGVTKHLLDVESKLGLVLLVLGFLSLGVGMLCNAATYLLVAP